jgi:hypothetical protein
VLVVEVVVVDVVVDVDDGAVGACESAFKSTPIARNCER